MYVYVAFLWMGMQEGCVLVHDSVILLLWPELLQDSKQTYQLISVFFPNRVIWRIFLMGFDRSDARTLSNQLRAKPQGLFTLTPCMSMIFF